jgi:pyruvate/2-oxoglutarate dehydrogenase complex dihydrolipoamide dehydrogenase (E3) component
MTDHVDLIILGSGSIAFAAALRAQELGKTSVMAEALKLVAISRFNDPRELSCCAE